MRYVSNMMDGSSLMSDESPVGCCWVDENVLFMGAAGGEGAQGAPLV